MIKNQNRNDKNSKYKLTFSYSAHDCIYLRILAIKTLHNILLSSALPFTVFDSAVGLVSKITLDDDNPAVLQYAAACVDIFLGESLHNR